MGLTYHIGRLPWGRKRRNMVQRVAYTLVPTLKVICNTSKFIFRNPDTLEGGLNNMLCYRLEYMGYLKIEKSGKR